MKFTLLVAAQLYGQKINLELVFPTFPSIGDVTRQIETTFSIEASAMRPPHEHFQPFRVDRLQIFDDRLSQWVDLLTTSQLVEFAQVYAFQRDAPLTEMQQQIPPARAPTSRPQASPVRATPIAVATSPPRPGASALYSTPVSAVATSLHKSYSPPRAGSPRRGIAGVTSSSAAVSAATVAAGRMPENATHETKLRLTFEELDTNKNRVIEMEEFRRAFKVLNVDFSAATVSDLFGRADSDRDGVISFADFTYFGSNYPTLLDSLYFRSRELYEEARRKQVVDSQGAAVEEARAKEAQAKQQAEDARRDLENQEKAIALAEQELQARLMKERDTRTAQMESKKEAERAYHERSEKERDLNGGREREHQRHQAVVETQRAVEQAERRAVIQENELAKCQEKERQLEALLAEARRESERQRTALQASTAELGQWRDREQQAIGIYADSQRDVQRLADALHAAELEHARRIEREREADVLLAESQRESARASARRDEEERELHLQRERDAHINRLHAESVRIIEENVRALRQLEQDMVDYLNRRQQVQAQEMPLLEQEVRLREQRYNLEEREIKLRTDTQSFTITSGRAALAPTPVTNYSASPAAGAAFSSPRRSPPRR